MGNNAASNVIGMPGSDVQSPASSPLPDTSGTRVTEGPLGSQQEGPLVVSLTRIQRADLGALASGNLALAASLTTSGTTNVVRELRRTSLGSGVGHVDGAMLDIVALLFDQVFACETIPPTMKRLIGQLQIPILKVAILDKSFLWKKTHSARKLLDCLGDVAVSLIEDLDESSPLYGQIQKTVRELVDGFQYSFDIFDRLHQELEAFVAWQNRPVEEQVELVARRVEYKERLALAKAVAQQEILRRARSGGIPRIVLRFLTDHWVKVMLIAHAKHGGKSEAWNKAVATMDLLIWSVRPKHSAADRRMLAAVLPKLLRRLNASMRRIGAEDEDRRQFFVKLMRCHVNATSSTSIGDWAFLFSPHADAVMPADEDMEPAAGPLVFQALTIRNPFGEGDIEIEDISWSDLIAGSKGPLDAGVAGAATGGDEHSRIANILREGAWADFRDEKNNKRRARLSYVSPLRRTYLFVNRQSATVCEYSVSQLARELRAGRASVVQTTPLFDQAMATVIGARGTTPTLH
jgi:hypothetical protein